MIWVRKKDVPVQAWQLGENSKMEKRMIREGKIVPREDGRYEVFSLEAAGATGQIAAKGDYFKVDPGGYPYPNEKAVFEKKHVRLKDDWYRQITEPLRAWTCAEPESEEIRYLLDSGILRVHPDDPGHYYSAMLWGTEETAAQTAVVMFYSVERDEDGRIRHIDFNFVEREYFDRTYEIIGGR